MNVKGSYLKNESGEIVSPVVNTETIYGNNGKSLLDLIYPVGSIFMSTNSTNPGTYLPNTTWTAWGSGKVPVGIDTNQTEFNSVEKTGGNKSITLTVEQLPSHSHTSQTYFQGNKVWTETLNKKIDVIVKQGKYLSLTGGVEDLQAGDIGYTYDKTDSIYPIPNVIKLKGAETKNTGSGSSINIQNPYIVCYMFKRIK